MVSSIGRIEESSTIIKNDSCLLVKVKGCHFFMEFAP
jgi:hypothetical protein